MATLDSRYTVNGLIDTSATALDNMTAITNSCNTWLSYDALEGKWAVVINRAGNATVSFSDSNIIGPINMTTTELTGYYNSCEVRFHNFDLRDREDYVLLEIPAEQRLPNEPDNRLIINAPMVNNQIQAQLIGLIELKQSRLDEVIEFTTDFSYVNIDAGTIIQVTNSVYGFTNKLFRVLTVSEQQTEAAIAIQITAQEYDANIYSDADLYLYLRDTEDGLIELDPLVDVSPVTENTQVVDSAGAINPLLIGLPLLMKLLDNLIGQNDPAGAGGIYDKYNTTFNNQTGKNITQSTVAVENNVTVGNSTVITKLTAMSATSNAYNRYNPTNQDNTANWVATNATIPSGWQTLSCEFVTPSVEQSYYMWDGSTVRNPSIRAQPAFDLGILYGSTLATATEVAASTIDWNSNTNKLVVTAPAVGVYWFVMKIIATYDLNMFWPTASGGIAGIENEIYFYNFVNLGAGKSDAQFRIAVSSS